MNEKIVLLTGATGFLGTQIARRLLREEGIRLIALVRAPDREGAARRLARAWWDLPSDVLSSPLPSQGRGAGGVRFPIEALPGDVSLSHLGLAQAEYEALAGRVTHILHAAADLRLNAPLDELRRTNVQGAANLIELARLARENGNLERFGHISTAYVAGGRSGSVSEADLSGEWGFSCAYEQSKYEGERLVQAARTELPISVFRPGMVVGDSTSGEIKTFNTFYFPLRLFLEGKLPLVPARRDLRLNLIPVDYVADAIVRLVFHPEAEGLTFHLTAPAACLPRAGELVAFVRDWARRGLGLRRPAPVFLPLPLPRGRYNPDHPAPDGETALAGLRQLLPYFSERLEFRRDNLDRLLGPYRLDWRDFLPRLLGYAAAHGFLHRAGRTVHEQTLARLASRSRRVTYYDLAGGQTLRREAGEVRADMLVAAGALRALGVQPGDRVAIVGLNSTRYLTLEVAIGLVGAVSVPLYYTSPPAELDSLLAASGARLFLVGAPAILARISELKTRIPLVSFCRETHSHPDPTAGTAEQNERKITPWDEFLALGREHPAEPYSPAGPDDLATLRYTSGTTGQPKGVLFAHRGLRWMAETLAGLLPWQARTHPARYLSFLPMNHVVEGLLATYAPYYIPAPVEIYFLEDLRDAGRVLPQVRPTIFFSVPRLYEKVWERLERSRAGKLYLGLPQGTARRLLRPLLRRAVLRRSGLDRCAQLLAGSAPSGQGLLAGFSELGIEVHNAYGMTEAPLVTLNRLGANRIGTVGEPLPGTEVRIAPDGEVLVRGPQVTGGYFEAESPVRDGWLMTGDLGHLTPEGSLVLDGRKKELIKTSYGKYIHPAKVEAALKAVPGVNEALLVGEARPFCVALLWLQDGADGIQDGSLDRAIAAANRGLSHPEQVKRWAVLGGGLSAEGGELTAILKLRREVVRRRFGPVVEALYGQGGCPADVIHLGEAES